MMRSNAETFRAIDALILQRKYRAAISRLDKLICSFGKNKELTVEISNTIQNKIRVLKAHVNAEDKKAVLQLLDIMLDERLNNQEIALEKYAALHKEYPFYARGYNYHATFLLDNKQYRECISFLSELLNRPEFLTHMSKEQLNVTRNLLDQSRKLLEEQAMAEKQKRLKLSKEKINPPVENKNIATTPPPKQSVQRGPRTLSKTRHERRAGRQKVYVPKVNVAPMQAESHPHPQRRQEEAARIRSEEMRKKRIERKKLVTAQRKAAAEKQRQQAEAAERQRIADLKIKFIEDQKVKIAAKQKAAYARDHHNLFSLLQDAEPEEKSETPLRKVLIIRKEHPSKLFSGAVPRNFEPGVAKEKLPAAAPSKPKQTTRRPR